MSAARNGYLKIFFSTFLLLIFFSCSQKTEKLSSAKKPGEIISISFSHIGGSSGNYRIIKVTEDSIHLEQGATSNNTHKQWDSAISAQAWHNLTSVIDPKTLNSIKSSPSAQSVDGIDETFQIKTPEKSHVYVNSFVDTAHYRQFQQFKDHVEMFLPKEYR